MSQKPRSYKQSDLKLLWGRAAARCAYPDCRTLCTATATGVDPAAVIGEIAHIVAHADAGPRGDASVPESARDSYANLILLCPTHHTLVDKQPGSVSAANLKAWKERHEAWVDRRLAEELVDIGFGELEQVIRALLAVPGTPETDLTITDPAEKLAKNDLGPRVRFTLTMGLGKVHEVREYIERMAQLIDPDFPERLRAGFVAAYRERRDAGLRGEALYEGMREFAVPAGRGFAEQAAGLAVLAYFFEACDIFER